MNHLSTVATVVLRRSISTVTIIGSGLMGSGIAQVCAQLGHNVNLVDMNTSLLQKASDRIEASLTRVAKKKHSDKISEQELFVQKCLQNIKMTTDASAAAAHSELVIEAIVENLQEKQKLFRLLDSVAPQNCLFTSNTSSLPITAIAEATKRQDRFGGLHFFNPVPMMALVEVVSTVNTSQSTNDVLFAFVQSLKKTPIRCRDTPGFVVNRLLVPLMAEAIRLVERGDASFADVDVAMRLGAGHPMGPFTLADYVGLDTLKFIMDGWHARFPDDPLFKPMPMLNELVAKGKFGIKSGSGFYDYKDKGSTKG